MEDSLSAVVDNQLERVRSFGILLFSDVVTRAFYADVQRLRELIDEERRLASERRCNQQK